MDVKFGGVITFKCSLQTTQETVSAYLFIFYFFICFLGFVSFAVKFENDDFSSFKSCMVYILFVLFLFLISFFRMMSQRLSALDHHQLSQLVYIR